MTYRGHVKNGQIMLDDPVQLLEGIEVRVDVIENAKSGPATIRIALDRRF